jgi:DNA-binding NarL/FixJ family response regulator
MPIKVLIVDDDAAFRRIARGALADRGYDVVGEAQSVAEARTAVAESRPDAVLLDVNLPDGNGIALAAELTGSLRVLLTSSEDAAPGTTPFVPKTELLSVDLAPYLG